MKIPENIRIAGVEYAVGYAPNLTRNSGVIYAHIDFNNTVIEFSTTVATSHQHRCITLWHEILHGISEHYGISLPDDDEEEIIQKMATGIYQVLQDNGGRLFDIGGEQKKEEGNGE